MPIAKPTAKSAPHPVRSAVSVSVSAAAPTAAPTAISAAVTAPVPAAGAAPALPKRSRGGPRGLRITDVARAAGVAPITVSRVFNSPETVAPETLERVREVIQKMGYVPNRLAGGLSSAKSRLIAAIVPTIAHSLFSESIQIFSETMARAGYQVLLALSGYAQDNEEALLESVLSRRPEAVLLIGVAHSDSLRERLRNVGIPIVETWDLTTTPIDMMVGFSHYRIGEAVAERFLARGVRHPGLVTANDSRAMARRTGFRDRLARAGVEDIAEVLVAPPSLVPIGRAALGALLERMPGLDGVFCGSDLLALGVLGEAQRRGIAVPTQLAICGFGDLEFATETRPALTTVQVDGARIGLNAARCLLGRLRGQRSGNMGDVDDVGDIIDVGFQLVARETA